MAANVSSMRANKSPMRGKLPSMEANTKNTIDENSALVLYKAQSYVLIPDTKFHFKPIYFPKDARLFEWH